MVDAYGAQEFHPRPWTGQPARRPSIGRLSLTTLTAPGYPGAHPKSGELQRAG